VIVDNYELVLYDSPFSFRVWLDIQLVGQLCRSKKAIGIKVQRFVGMIPKAVVDCNVQPVTQDVFRFQVELIPDFEWQTRWHGGAVFFWLWVEDSQSQRIYHQEQLIFTKKNHPDPLYVEMFIPAFHGTAAQYILRVVSDSWVGVELDYPISLEATRIPKQISMNTDLMDLTPLPTTALRDEKYEQLFSSIETFNPVQTQLFHVLYHTDYPVLLGAPTGSGKTVVGELALLRMKRRYHDGICVYIAPLKSLARERLKEWKKRFGGPPMHWKVLEVSGDTHHDRRSLERADILVCTPEKWDLISRGWRGSVVTNQDNADRRNNRSFVQRVRLLVIDEIHLLGEERGAVLEAIVSRTRFISRFLEQDTVPNTSQSKATTEMVRIVGLSTAVANPLDLADWIGIDTETRRGLYNFRPSIRPVPIQVHVQGYPGKHYCARMATMNKPCYAAIKQYSPDRPSLIFVASRRQTRLTAFDLISYAAGDGTPKAFLDCDDAYIDAIAGSIKDESLRHTIIFGIGLHHAGLSSADRDIVERLYLGGEIRVLVATATLAWVR
jgi:activating signal cointegrator complex subunit 3